MQRGISLAIAVACAVAALALQSGALPRPLATLVSRPAPATVSPTVLPLQRRLTALLDGTVGPGRAAVTVDAIVDRNRMSAQSLRYARRGVAVSSRSAR